MNDATPVIDCSSLWKTMADRSPSADPAIIKSVQYYFRQKSKRGMINSLQNLSEPENHAIILVSFPNPFSIYSSRSFRQFLPFGFEAKIHFRKVIKPWTDESHLGVDW